MKRKNPEDGKEESSMSGGESSLYTDEKNSGTSKVCDHRWRVPYTSFENTSTHKWLAFSNDENLEKQLHIQKKACNHVSCKNA